MPLPAAEKGMASYPQPRRWRAVVKQARERQSGKVEKASAVGGPGRLLLPKNRFPVIPSQCSHWRGNPLFEMRIATPVTSVT